MERNIIGALVCALIGFAVAFLNYFVSKKVLETRAEKFASVTFLRQGIQIAYLIGVYFIGTKFGFDIIYLLVGAVLGMTVPMFFFTKKLVSLNESKIKKSDREEADRNG